MKGSLFAIRNSLFDGMLTIFSGKERKANSE